MGRIERSGCSDAKMTEETDAFSQLSRWDSLANSNCFHVHSRDDTLTRYSTSPPPSTLCLDDKRTVTTVRGIPARGTTA